METKECLVCLKLGLPLNLEKSEESVQKNEEIFNILLDILNVNLNPFNWDFQTEVFPFCSVCTEIIHQIISVHERLVQIQEEMTLVVEDMKAKLREAESSKTSVPTDVRVIIFRGQILRQAPDQSSNFNQKIFSTPVKRILPRISSEQSLPTVSSVSATQTQAPTVIVNTTPTSQGYNQLCQVGQTNLPGGSIAVTTREFQDLIKISNSTNTTTATFSHLDDSIPVAANETVAEENFYPAVEYSGDEDYVNDDYEQNEEHILPDRSPTPDIKKTIKKIHKREIKTPKSALKAPKSKRKKIPIDSDQSDYNDMDNSIDYVPENKKSKVKNKINKRDQKQKRVKKPRKTSPKPKGVRKPRVYKRREGVKPATAKRRSTVKLQVRSDGREFLQDIELIPLLDGFACGQCDMRFASGPLEKSKLRTHIRGVHLGLFKCNICNDGKSFRSSITLSNHIRRYHKFGGWVECDICLKPLLGESLPRHRFLHKSQEEKEEAIANGLQPKAKYKVSGPKICLYCGMELSSSNTLRQHEKIHLVAQEDRKTYTCNLCGNKYNSQKTLDSHLLYRCKSKEHLGRKFQCSVCDYVTKSECMLKLHKNKHLHSLLKKHELPFECPICSKRMATKIAVRGHYKNVHKEGDSAMNYTHPCSYCGQRFKKRKTCVDHERKLHPEVYKEARKEKQLTKIKPEFLTKKIENEHHKTEKLIIIPDCKADNDEDDDEKFRIVKTDEGLMTFRKIPITSIENGYNCGQCNQSITDLRYPKHAIRDHINGLHFGSFQCTICQKFFPSKHSLGQHTLNTHNRVCCNVCERPGLAPRSMVTHLWSHKSESERQSVIEANEYWKVPYEFRAQYGMKGSKGIFACNICFEGFKHIIDLKAHKNKQHGTQYTGIIGATNRRKGRKKSKHTADNSESEMSESEISEVEMTQDENEDEHHIPLNQSDHDSDSCSDSGYQKKWNSTARDRMNKHKITAEVEYQQKPSFRAAPCPKSKKSTASPSQRQLCSESKRKTSSPPQKKPCPKSKRTSSRSPQRKPCPKSKRQKLETTDKSLVLNLNSDSKSPCRKKKNSTLANKKTKLKETEISESETSDVECASSFVSLFQLPDTIQQGRSLKVVTDSIIRATTYGGKKKEVYLRDPKLTVDQPKHRKSKRIQPHYEIKLSSSEESDVPDDENMNWNDEDF